MPCLAYTDLFSSLLSSHTWIHKALPVVLTAPQCATQVGHIILDIVPRESFLPCVTPEAKVPRILGTEMSQGFKKRDSVHRSLNSERSDRSEEIVLSDRVYWAVLVCRCLM
jgi:hypothetical protein